MKEQEKSTTRPTHDELILCVKLMLCSIEGVCSGIKSEPDYLSSYGLAQELLGREKKFNTSN